MTATPPTRVSWIDHLVVAGLFAVLALLALAGFVAFIEPPARQPRPAFTAQYSEAPLDQALAAGAITQRLAAIRAAGAAPGERGEGRFTGSPGFYRTESLIRDAFREAGLTLQTQEFRVVVPATVVCEILDESGAPLPDIKLFPFQPAGLSPIALPPAGLSGELVITESTDMIHLTGHLPATTFVATYLDDAAGWRGLASVGVQAILVMEDNLARKLRNNPDEPAPWDSLFCGEEIAFPRFLVRGPLTAYAGRNLRIRAKVVWEEKTVRNLIGVLKGDNPKSEALILNTYYDSSSIVPELAPGAEQAVPLAVQLEFLRALAPYRGALNRDVIFIATAGHAQALSGVSRLMEAVETFTVNRPNYTPPEARRAEHEAGLVLTEQALARLGDDSLWGPGSQSDFKARWLAQDEAFRTWFDTCVTRVSGEFNLDFKDQALELRLAYLRAGSPVFRDGFDSVRTTDDERKAPANRHPLFAALLEAQQTVNKSAGLMGLPLWQLVEKPEFMAWPYRDRLRTRLLALAAHHRQAIRELDDTQAVRALLKPYRQTLVLNLELSSGGARKSKTCSLLTGIFGIGSDVEPQVTQLANALLDKIPLTNNAPVFSVIHWGGKDVEGTRERPNLHASDRIQFESEPWVLCGRLAFTLLNANFKSAKIGSPDDTFDTLSAGVLDEQLPYLARGVLSLAQGRVPFKSIPSDRRSRIHSLQGAVFGSAGAQTLTPSHPMAENTFVRIVTSANQSDSVTRGVNLSPLLKTDPFGRYEKALAFGLVGRWASPLKADAARFQTNGLIAYFKNAAASGQSVFKNEAVNSGDIVVSGGKSPKPVLISVFRCARVQQFDWNNPQTMKSFQRMNYLARQGLTEPPNFRNDTYTAFLDPDLYFYLGLMAGAADNKEVQTYRAFMLNAEPGAPITTLEPEIQGRGYLAADTPNIAFAHIDAAESMLRSNEKRLRLQRLHGMADSLMLDFHESGRKWLDIARAQLAEKNPLAAVLAADTSLAYAINNHPVIRSRISHAIIGILWYLGLLVPFVFFFEKLVFGFTDVRKQLLAGGLIFLVVFLLLRFFHPAFQMVRSSLMILIGFVILLLTLLVILMVGGKFKQNIRDLRQKEGTIEGADIDRGGVIGTAFMLGLNNMRRRKVRTGLTSITLVLITFVMICFTSVSSDLVNIEYATGRSPWNGILLRNPGFTPLASSEIATIQQIYGRLYPVTTRAWFCGTLNSDRLQNSEILVDREFDVNGQKVQKRARLSAALRMDWNEPDFSGIDRYLITSRTWFPRGPSSRAERQAALAKGYTQKRFVILPDAAARDLELSAEEVQAGGVTVTIRGDPYTVLGIIDSARLQKHIDLDGKSLLPYDLNSVQTLGRSAAGGAIMPEDSPRLPGAQVMIVNTLPMRTDRDGDVLVSCGILFPRASYTINPRQPPLPPLGFKDQRRLVMDYLERLGQPAYYAIDGTSYFGSRTRARTFAGLLELLIPILIASLTVFNTMRSSVYERKDEIYVYNAVGIAPNHVFFMFMAEASVYAVVGAMLGYLLSQATGRLLSVLHLTGGMNMSYSSIETIYASLAIVVAVMLSTLIPARSAAKLASPSGKTEWEIPKADGDTMAFNLPFTFTPHDRVAVISYFHRWLDSNGEGSSGPFFCAPPQPMLTRGQPGQAGLVPGVTATVWLKPFDLGVSQRLEITLPTDPETGEFIATITLTRLSGTASAWARAVKPFLAVLRKQFLTWRAARLDERADMYQEATRLLAACPIKETRS